MSSKEILLRLIEQLPEDRLAELEQLAVSMLTPDESLGRPREPRLSFEEALASVNETFPNTLRRLSQ